jgi:hypothetical protein
VSLRNGVGQALSLDPPRPSGVERDGPARETLQRLVSVCSDCTDSLTVSLEMGEYQHTVHWADGAKVPGLSEWTF